MSLEFDWPSWCLVVVWNHTADPAPLQFSRNTIERDNTGWNFYQPILLRDGWSCAQKSADQSKDAWSRSILSVGLNILYLNCSLIAILATSIMEVAATRVTRQVTVVPPSAQQVSIGHSLKARRNLGFLPITYELLVYSLPGLVPGDENPMLCKYGWDPH